MTQYQKSGPPPPDKPEQTDYTSVIHRLERRLDDQAQHIKDLDREVRRLKNDLRVAINALSLRSNGKT